MWDAGRGRAYKIMPEAIKSLGKTALLGSTQVRQSEVAIFPIFDVINLGAGPRCRFSFFGGPGFLLFFFQFGYSASRHLCPSQICHSRHFCLCNLVHLDRKYVKILVFDTLFI